MKKPMITLLLIGATLPVVAARVGDTFQSGGLMFAVTSSSDCRVSGLAPENLTAGKVEIPSSVSLDDATYSVTSISPRAFKDNHAITAVTIMGSVKEIGDSAFMNCKALSTVDMGPDAEIVGVNSFCDCPVLSSVNWSAKLAELRSGAFQNSAKLAAVTLPSSLKYIADRAFYGSGVKNLKLPANLKNICHDAFSSCNNIINLQYPDSLEEIPENCNLHSASLATLQLGPKVKTIGDGAFANCPQVSEIVLKGIEPPVLTPAAFEKRGLLVNLPHADYQTCKIYVPKGCVDKYRQAQTWSKFANITDNMDDFNPSMVDLAYFDSNPNTQTGEPFIKAIYIYNRGNDTISSLTYSYTVDGGEPIHKTCGRAVPGRVTSPWSIEFYFDPIMTEGTKKIILTVDSADCRTNKGAKKTLEFSLNMYDIKGQLPDSAKSIDYMEYVNGGYFGINGNPLHFEIATHFFDQRFNGMEIVAFESCYNRDGNENFNMWTSSFCPTGSQRPDGEIAYNVPMVDGNVLMVLKNPIKVTNKGAYLGYSFDVGTSWGNSSIKYPVCFMNTIDNTPLYGKESLMYRTDTLAAKWYSSNYNSNIKVYLRGNFPKSDLLPQSDIGLHTVAVGDTCIVEFWGQNNGWDDAETVTYTYTVDGQQLERTATLEKPMRARLLMTQRFSLPFDGFETPGSKTFDVAITKVNGIDNPNFGVKIPLSVVAAMSKPVHHVLFEEGTGTWCGWCPRGVAGMYWMEKTHPDYIGIAYHTNDAIEPDNDDITQSFFSAGRPTCTLDRGENMDPYLGKSKTDFGIEKDYLEAERQIAPAVINLDTKWSDDKMSITVDADVDFFYTEDGVTYKLGYIATLDGISDPADSDLKQKNGYEGDAAALSNPYLHVLVDGTLNLNVFNHVVFAGNNMGIPESLPATVEENGNYKHQYFIDCSGYDYYEPACADKVNVVAMLIDSNGRVRNARKVKAGEKTERNVGVSDVSVDGPESQAIYYDLTGRRVTQPRHGLYIKRRGNNATKVLM